MKSKNFNVNVVLLMGIGIQTFEFFFIVVTFLTKKEIMAVLAHPAILLNRFFTRKAIILLIIPILSLKNGFHLMISPMHFVVE